MQPAVENAWFVHFPSLFGFFNSTFGQKGKSAKNAKKSKLFLFSLLTFQKLCAIIYKSQRSGCGAAGSALPWGGRGRKFKSCHSDQHQSLCPVRVSRAFLFICLYGEKPRNIASYQNLPRLIVVYIYVWGGLNVGVSEPILNVFNAPSVVKQYRGCGVSEIVKSHFREVYPFKLSLKRSC